MTEEQLNRVYLLLHSEHIDRRYEVLTTVEDAEELHQFALNYNWDDGCKFLEQVIDSPLCDQGTALLLFWLGDPSYFYQSEVILEEWERDAFKVVKKIEAKYLADGFQSHRIRVDPRDIFGVDYLADCEGEPGFDHIPEELKQPSPGSTVQHIEL